MSPIFAPDFTAVDASIPVFDKSRYRVKVTGRKPIIQEKKDKQTGAISISSGVRYALEMVGVYDEKGKLQSKNAEGPIKGKTVSPYTVWTHSDGGWKFGKPFLMAANGFDVRKEEQKANKDLFQKNDWTVQGELGDTPETMKLGNGWDLAVDRLVDVTLSKKVTKNDAGDDFENQEFGGWAPVTE